MALAASCERSIRARLKHAAQCAPRQPEFVLYRRRHASAAVAAAVSSRVMAAAAAAALAAALAAAVAAAVVALVKDECGGTDSARTTRLAT